MSKCPKTIELIRLIKCNTNSIDFIHTGDCIQAIADLAEMEAENKRYRDFIICEIDHARAFIVLADEAEKSNIQMFINRAVEALKESEK